MGPIDKVIFFDGICNLCNQSVNLLLKMDSKKILKYSSLQGQLANKILKKENDNTNDSFIFLFNGKVLCRSKAVIAVLKQLGGLYKVIGFTLAIFPSSFLDIFYNLIAKNRYRLFGKQKHCRMPTEEEKNQFID